MNRSRSLLLVFAVVLGSVVACSGGTTAACADELAKGGSSGGVSGGGGAKPASPAAPSKPGGVSGGGGAKPAPPSGSKSGGVSKPVAPPKSSSQTKAAASSSPKKPPSAADASAAKSAAPPNISRGGNYTSPVTGNVYVFHSQSYYTRPGIYVDLYDVYNPYNYWYWPSSPFYGQPYRYAGGCGQAPREVKAEAANNINITIDNDGKIVSAEDKNEKDPELIEVAELDDDPTEGTTPGTGG